MTIPARDHTGQTYGVATAIGLYPELDDSGRRLYRVFWACCGSETIERQKYLTHARTQPPTGCRECHQVGQTPITTDGDTPGYLDIPGWGRVFPLRGPMGPRGGMGSGHTGWAKREGVEE
jgi:hypothetical protein